MSCYTTGSVTVTVASQVVVGSGTDMVSYGTVGDIFKLTDESVFYEIATISSATKLILNSKYQNGNYASDVTLSGMNFQLVTQYTPNFNFPEISSNDTNFAHIHTRSLRMIDSDMKNPKASSYFQCGSHQYIFFGAEITEAGVVSVGTNIDASLTGSLYMSTAGRLWVFDSDTTATSLKTN